MMNLVQWAAVAFSCLALGPNFEQCLTESQAATQATPSQVEPEFTGEALDVVLTAQAALVWDEATGIILYERSADVRRPVASLSKLASALIIREKLPLEQVVEISGEVRGAQRRGANIQLPVGHHATVHDLLAASLTASANDAMVALAVAAGGSEEQFMQEVNQQLPSFALKNTKLSNATGLQALPADPARGEQYSTAQDIRRLLELLTQDPVTRSFLSSQGGVLTTVEGTRRSYKTTNKLLGTYLPVIAAKTGYTVEAGQNLAMLTQTQDGHPIGAVVLGSDERFQDMKILVEWINRNYTWR